MLQSMRHLSQSWIVKGLMLFLMASFSIWGIGDIFRGNPLQKTVAKVGDVDITVQDLNHAFDRHLADARRSIDPAMTPAQARKLGLLDRTLDAEVKRSLVDQDIVRLGINVDANAVMKLLADQTQFRTKDGVFNKDLFRQVLEQQGLTERTFLTQGQQDLSRQVMLGALGGGGTLPQSEIDALYKARAQKRVLDVVTIDPAKIGGVGEPDDKAVQAFYDQNPMEFTAPEYRGLTIAVLSTDALAKDISISDAAVQKEYDAKKDQMANPEQRDVVQVVLQDEGKAKALAQAARAAGDLTTAAKKSGDNAVPLNAMTEKNLMPELAKVVFGLPQGQIADPVKTQLGWHVMQVAKIHAAGIPAFDSVREKMRSDMQRDEAIEAATKTVNQLDDELAAGHSLDDIADGLKLRLIKIAAVDQSGLQPDGKEPKEFPDREAILKDVFAQNSGDSSPVEDDKAGNYFVARTDTVTPSAVKPLSEIKPAVVAAWKAHAQAVKAQDAAGKIAQELRDGKPLTAFDGREGMTTRVSTPLSQLGDSDALLPASLTAQAFKIKKGETAIAAASPEGGRNQVVVRLAQIVDVDAAAKDPRKNMIIGQVRKTQSDELLEQYIAHLYDVFPVKIDTALVDHMRQQDN